ncbi:MAG: phosphatidate cytidylyltransferase [Phycisphaerae bacterium]|nr:phosphatidate cytidylyltransferase [Phycisphaerae bacterium]
MPRLRIIFGTLMGAGFVALLWADWLLDTSCRLPGGTRGLLFAILVTLLALGGCVELYRMARAKGVHPLVVAGCAGAMLLAASPFLATLGRGTFNGLPLFALGAAIVIVFVAQCVEHRTDNAIPNLAATLLGVAYCGGLAAFVVLIRLEFGTFGLLLYLAAVKFTDIGAWAVGRAIGRHKMIPWLSPGKSWEGLAGGVAAAMLVSIGLAIGLDHFGQHVMGIAQAAVFGLVMAPVGQGGDLAESLLKRDAGVKDSGATIPGFGGLLDVLDSPLGAAPIGYLMLRLLA